MKAKIAHLSDPHFGTIKPEVLRGLKESLKDLAPDLVIITGDITQRAQTLQFKEAREFLETLEPIPVIIMPGNHDIALYNGISRLFFPYWNFKKYLKGSFNELISFSDIEVFALNSTSRLRIVQGKLIARRLKKLFWSYPKKKSIRIAAFHHPMACPKRVDTKNLLIDRCQVMKILEGHEIDLVLNGHIHDPFIALSHEHYPDVERATIIAVAGTCLSWRTRADAPNSYHWIEIDTEAEQGPHLQISRFDIQKDCKFRSVSREEFIRQEDSGWQRANFPTREIFDPGDEFQP